MIERLFLLTLPLLAVSLHADAQRPLPIIDMHLHANSQEGEEATVQKTETCADPLMSSRDGEEKRASAGEMMERHNI